MYYVYQNGTLVLKCRNSSKYSNYIYKAINDYNLVDAPVHFRIQDGKDGITIAYYWNETYARINGIGTGDQNNGD